MTFLGFTIERRKQTGTLSSVPSRGGWFPYVREAFGGAWQRNIEVKVENVLTFSTVYACVTLIASDIGKLCIDLVQEDAHGIWKEIEVPAFSPVLRKPNRYQTRIEFLEQWVASKLIHGNTYVLKQRDNRQVVTALYVLDPLRCRPLVASDGSVYYAIDQDDLAQVDEQRTIVPASEIIHDKMVTFYHPLVGVSPISACGLAAMQGLRVQQNSEAFFKNGAMPSGVLTAPGVIADETAKRLKDLWDSQYSGQNVGQVAVLGDGLKYEQMTMSAVDAQLIEQLKWTAENVCQAFHVPTYMVNVGPAPAYNNVEALSQQYYSQTLQSLIEKIELLLDEGLALPVGYGTELDLDDLLRMDTPSRVKAAADAIGSGGMSPNEARYKYLDLGPVEGGDSPYLQQQNYSLSALSRRDASADPFQTSTPAAPAPPDDAEDPDDETEDEPDAEDTADTETIRGRPSRISGGRMTDKDLAALAQGLTPVVRDLLTTHLDGLMARIVALDARAVTPGRDGRDGIPGPIGERGPQGEPGAAGRDGQDGASGQDGADGLHGKDGLNGIDGTPGEKGDTGLNGRDGADGLHGKDGAPGQDGVILGPTDIKVFDAEDGGRTFALGFGDTVTLRAKTGILLDRGVWIAGRAYETGDGVTRGGSFWIAQADTQSQPGTDGTWRLAVKRGSDGKTGPAGKDGRDGLPGKDGRSHG